MTYCDVTYRTSILNEDMVEMPDAYCFNKAARFHWLQRLCLWILKTLRCSAWVKHTERLYREPTGQTIIDQIWEQQSEVFGLLNAEATVVLMGPEDLEKLLRLDATTHEHAVHWKAEIQGNGSPRHPRVLGLDIVTVPWMRGVLVAPPVSRWTPSAGMPN
jgi:hypothetical protein